MRKMALAALMAASLAAFGCAAPAEQPAPEEQEEQQAQEGPVDKSDLQDAIDSQQDYEEAAYPSASWKKYSESLSAAKATMEDGEATQEEVDDAERSLLSSERSMKRATDREHPIKFGYEWYKAGDKYKRDGTWTTAACMVKSTFNDGDRKLIVATIANDDATLSDCDVLLQPTSAVSFESLSPGDVLAILGTTEQMKTVTIGKTYEAALPAINVVELEVAP